MVEFDIVLENIQLHIICEEYKKYLILELMSGHCYTDNISSIPTYNLVLKDYLSKNTKGTYIKMTDKWFDNATCDVWIDNFSKTVSMGNIQASKEKWKNLLIQYFTCNVFNRLLEEIGYIAFHSSCVDKDGIGFAFIAPRNSGKTNCMLNLMNEGYNSVTNDKLAIMYDGNDLKGYGVAQDVSIRISPSFRLQPENSKYLKYAEKQHIKLVNDNLLEGNKILLDSIKLAKINNVQQIPTTKIKTIFYPQYNSEIKKVIFEKLTNSQVENLLNDQRLPLVHDTTKFLSEIKSGNFSEFDEHTIYSKLLDLDAYKIIQGEKTRESYVNEMNLRIKKLKH